MFGRKNKKIQDYDKENWKPVIRASICTGEKTAGFKNLKTGEFKEECLLRNDSDLQTFMDKYGIDGELEKIY